MIKLQIQTAIAGTALLSSLMAVAQTPDPAAAAQRRYENTLAGCNSGGLAAPAREACVRAAGNSLDAARGGPPADVAVPSADGRATVVAPAGSAAPVGGSDTATSRDGRATVVLPSDRTVPR